VRGQRLQRSFFTRDALVVAPDLLNKLLWSGPVVGRIVETEAYLAEDPASHAFRGRTARNGSMFGVGGTLYVYLSYGLHHCLNVVTGSEGDGQAVLVRAVVPVAGLDVVADRRPVRLPRDWTNGPGKVASALGLDMSHDGADLCSDAGVGIGDDGTLSPEIPMRSARIGISTARDRLWRFQTPGA
jgi:DNA-3-methyladenine glycosylase